MRFLVKCQFSSNAWLRSNWRQWRIFSCYYLFFMSFKQRSHGYRCFCIGATEGIRLSHQPLPSNLRARPSLRLTSTGHRGPRLRLCWDDAPTYVDLDPHLRSCIQVLLRPYSETVPELPYHSQAARAHLLVLPQWIVTSSHREPMHCLLYQDRSMIIFQRSVSWSFSGFWQKRRRSC